ncbi:TPA: tetratricopeptide repeat protein, partial [Candidatus Poribacteria bacterium]|nr:tetratricopeptide repeat protein [Candidatus Poribacteria bacterium]
TQLAEIELERSNFKKAKNYLLAALAIDPQNEAAKTIWGKLNQ